MHILEKLNFFKIDMLGSLGLPKGMGTLQLPLLPQTCFCSPPSRDEIYRYIYIGYIRDLQILHFQLSSHGQLGRDVKLTSDF